MAKDNTIRDSYIEKFIKEHSGSRVMKLDAPVHEAFHGYHDEQIVFDDVKCALAYRLSGNTDGFYLPEGLSLDGRESKNMLLDAKNFCGSWALKNPLDKNGKNFKMHCSGDWGRVIMYATRYNKERQEEFSENLTYDGICAYMALGFRNSILKDKDFLKTEMDRCATEELDAVDKTKEDAPQEMNEIGEKYVELKYVLDGLCEGFVYEKNKEIEEQVKRQEEENANVEKANETYNEVMQRLTNMNNNQVAEEELSQ